MDETLRYIPELPQVPLLEAPKWWHRFSKRGAFIIGLVPIIILFSLFIFFILAPNDFPGALVYRIKSGETLSSIASRLESAHIVKSALVLKVLVRALAPKSGALAGDYEFNEPQNAVTVAWRIGNGSYDLTPERVTIPEGMNSVEIADIFSKNKKFYAFDAQEFKNQAAKYEGYLFPDTYFFLPNATVKQVIDMMTETYKKRIATIAAEVTSFGRPIEDVINMASIVEREARTKETRRTIAGILWKRLDQGMPLQVDAAFAFVNGKKDSRLLTLDDLKIESPYNTYLHKGLPPGPIGNPGLEAISDTVHPLASPYYFYLSDSQGNMHYAVTHAEHVANKDKYLR